MDGFSGFKSAAAEEVPDAVPVMGPFHVIRVVGDALDNCRRRVQQQTCGHRGRVGDPLYSACRTLHTGADLLTEKQHARLETLFTADVHVEVEASWGVYHRMVAAYREPDRTTGRELMQAVIDSLSTGVPTAFTEPRTLGCTLKRLAQDVRSYFERPGTSNGPTEVPPSASGISPTMSPDRCWNPADSDRNYTLNSEEPDCRPQSLMIRGGCCHRGW